MNSQIIDSKYHGHLFSTEKSREIFNDDQTIQRWLDIESNLAQTQAELNIIPTEAAIEIEKTAKLNLLNNTNIVKNIKETEHSLVGLLKEVQRVCNEEARQYLHFGATTQDIQDTGQVLAIKQVLSEVEKMLEVLMDKLKHLAIKYQSQIQVGRTHAQPALPITFGLKVASWIDEIQRNQQRLKELKERVLVIQMFGACGTMSVFGNQGLELLNRLAQKLSLSVPKMSWHTARDRMVEFVFALSLTAGTLSRIAEEIRTLSRFEINEIQVPWKEGVIASSTLPQKRNPDDCEQVIVLFRLLKGLAVSSLDTLTQDHERDFRGTRIEWVSVVDASHYALKSLEITTNLIDNLKINEAQMTSNVDAQKYLIGMEKLVFELAQFIGKDKAFEKIYNASQVAQSSKGSIIECLAKDPIIGHFFAKEDLEKIISPDHNLGATKIFIERVLNN